MPSPGVAAVDRALSILAAFEDAPEPMTLAELARRTKMYKSTLLRLMTSLQEFGYLVQFADGRYHLGPTPFRLGAVYQRSNNLHDRVVPLLRQLVADGTDVSWVVLQCEAVTDIDVTAAEVLKDLDEEVNAQGVHLAFVELRDRLQDLVQRYGLHSTLDREHFYPSLDAALDDIGTDHLGGPDLEPPANGAT